MRRLSSLAHIWTIGLGVVTLMLFLTLLVRVAVPAIPWLQRPTVQMMSPSDGAIDVISRRSIDITFSQPMNRSSVEQALNISPATAGTFSWSDDARVLRFLPQTSLATGVTYTVQIGTGALGRWWQPLDQPVRMAFTTARSPSLVSAFPDTAAVSPDTPIMLVFSQPMVTIEKLGLPVDALPLQIEPPVQGEARWIDTDTLLFRPDQPFLADTHYRAALQPLSDVRGIALDQPFSWDWTTQATTLIARVPAANDRWVAPRQPLVMTFRNALDPATLQDRLVITPTITGDLTATMQLSGTQVVTFTPTVDWQPDQTYMVGFALDTHVDANHSEGRQTGVSTSPARISWSFATAPRPALAGRFPGEGQLLPRGQSVRLIFRTPMDADALKAGLTVQPPVDDIQVSVSDTEVRLLADWQPATAYTLTLAASIVDRNGTALAQDYRLNFLTDSALPALQLPDLVGYVVSMPTNQPSVLTVEHTNLSALDLSLYALDEATLLRTLSFNTEAWNDFQPERYNQPLLRTWRVPLNDPRDQPVQEQVRIGTTEQAALDTGAYYLLIRSPEGVRSDAILIVSDVELALKQSDKQVLVWAIDLITGEPLVDLPLTLYRGDEVVARSQTDGNGVWQIRHPQRSGGPPYLVIAGGPQPAVVSSAWRLQTEPDTADPAEYQAALVTNRPTYAPGETIRVGGYVRQIAPDGSLALPTSHTELELTLQPVNGIMPDAPYIRLTLPASGVVSSSLVLDADIPPGQYLVQGTVEQTSVQIPIRVFAVDAPLHVQFGTAQDDITNSTGMVMLPLEITSADRPVGGAQVTWNSQALPIPADVPVDSDALASFHFGSPAPINVQPFVQSGSGQSDAAGRFMLPLASLSTLTQTLQYEITVDVTEPGGLTRQVTTVTTVSPPGPHVGLHLPSRIVTVDERAVVDVLALDRSGFPVTDARIDVDLFRREWLPPSSPTVYLQVRDTIVLTRRALTDDQGRAELRLPLLSAGEYYLVARSEQQQSSATLWVTASGYSGWSDEGTQVALVADQDVYRVGETARLLVALPDPQASVLLSRTQGDQFDAEVYALRAGQILEMAITPDMAPTVDIGVLVASAVANGQVAPIRAGSTQLRVLDDPPGLTTVLELDQQSYLPGTTATVTITTRNQAGRGVSANLLLAVTGYADSVSGDALPPTPPLMFDFARPSRLITAAGSVIRTTLTRSEPVAPRTLLHTTSAGVPARVSREVFWNANLRTGSDGTLVVQIPLPTEAGTWHMWAYATRGATLFDKSYARLSAVPSLLIEPVFPPILRIGDTTRGAFHVHNTAPISQEVRATLSAVGLTLLDNTGTTQIQPILPGSVQTFAWDLLASGKSVSSANLPARATLQFDAESSTGDRVSTSISPALAPATALSVETHTVEMTDPLSHSLEIGSFAANAHNAPDCGDPPAPCRWATLELAIAPHIRAAISDSAIALSSLSPRTVEQEASLLLLSAALSDAGGHDVSVWQEQVRRSLEALDLAQSDNGGWGWMPGDPAHPFMTGYVLEARMQASVVLSDALEPEPQALAILRQADHAGADPNLRAYIQYVLTRLGEGDLADARALLDLDLQADGLAYLALTLPPAEVHLPLTRLLALAQSEQSPVGSGDIDLISWDVQGNAPLARSAVSTTALAVQVLQQYRPDTSQLAPALHALRLAWGVDGWPTAYGSARAATVLLAEMGDNNPTIEPGYQVAVNGNTVLSPNQSLERTRHILLTGQQLQERNTLHITPARNARSASPALLAYRLSEQAATSPAHTDALVVYQDYLDPSGNTRLDPHTLYAGQLVRVRLTLAALQPVSFVTLESHLPAAFVPLGIDGKDDNLTPFTAIFGSDGVTMLATDLLPGVYTQTYLVRVVHAGSFAVPPPLAAPAYMPDQQAHGLPGRVDVAWP